MTEQLSTIAKELTGALANAEKAHAALELAQAKLAPLEQGAKEADDVVHVLMNQYQSLTGGTPTTTKERKKRASGKTPEAEVIASYHRVISNRMGKDGKAMPFKEAQKFGIESAKALAAKYHIPVPAVFPKHKFEPASSAKAAK